ncbi:phenylacetate--CoA ligase family protein [Sphingobacterium suaedae]|uniref:Phenylacetate--CoA ligase family protein n=1 Tax=Sphingobacterium suaedae TaxID=1686402 RepID=A0ABW5KKC5_9SPHI
MKNWLYKNLPVIFQELLISIFNILAYRKRYGQNYKKYRQVFLRNRTLAFHELLEIQKNRFGSFLAEAIRNSKYYADYEEVSIEDIERLPIIKKEILRNNINQIVTLKKHSAVVSKTGGTTGKSLEVLYTIDNLQERFAQLDDFRNRFGYELGKRTAWFSGKSLLTDRDINKKIFWKTDHLHNVRYYSTFHMNEKYLEFYVENLIKYKPEYLVGFPSTMMEIAKFGLKMKVSMPKGIVKAIFPTAETVTSEMRNSIEAFFQANMYNQYASSEGAPFIFECIEGNLHLELQSGVFEVLDENDQPTDIGRLVVTSFTTCGTPLIRYDIGDRIILDTVQKKCNCGNNNPIVKEILGRIDDYVYSPETGKINLGNVSNTLKDVKGIVQFQVVQNSITELELFLVVDKEMFDEDNKNVFLKNWRDRVGERMKLNVHVVKNIEVEKSGKYRLVKNNIKDLVI